MEYILGCIPDVSGYKCDEDGYRLQYHSQGYRGCIEGRKVKEMK